MTTFAAPSPAMFLSLQAKQLLTSRAILMLLDCLSSAPLSLSICLSLYHQQLKIPLAQALFPATSAMQILSPSLKCSQYFPTSLSQRSPRMDGLQHISLSPRSSEQGRTELPFWRQIKHVSRLFQRRMLLDQQETSSAKILVCDWLTDKVLIDL